MKLLDFFRTTCKLTPYGLKCQILVKKIGFLLYEIWNKNAKINQIRLLGKKCVLLYLLRG